MRITHVSQQLMLKWVQLFKITQFNDIPPGLVAEIQQMLQTFSQDFCVVLQFEFNYVIVCAEYLMYMIQCYAIDLPNVLNEKFTYLAKSLTSLLLTCCHRSPLFRQTLKYFPIKYWCRLLSCETLRSEALCFLNYFIDEFLYNQNEPDFTELFEEILFANQMYQEPNIEVEYVDNIAHEMLLKCPNFMDRLFVNFSRAMFTDFLSGIMQRLIRKGAMAIHLNTLYSLMKIFDICIDDFDCEVNDWEMLIKRSTLILDIIGDVIEKIPTYRDYVKNPILMRNVCALFNALVEGPILPHGHIELYDIGCRDDEVWDNEDCIERRRQALQLRKQHQHENLSAVRYPLPSIKMVDVEPGAPLRTQWRFRVAYRRNHVRPSTDADGKFACMRFMGRFCVIHKPFRDIVAEYNVVSTMARVITTIEYPNAKIRFETFLALIAVCNQHHYNVLLLNSIAFPQANIVVPASFAEFLNLQNAAAQAQAQAEAKAQTEALVHAKSMIPAPSCHSASATQLGVSAPPSAYPAARDLFMPASTQQPLHSDAFRASSAPPEQYGSYGDFVAADQNAKGMPTASNTYDHAVAEEMFCAYSNSIREDEEAENLDYILVTMMDGSNTAFGGYTEERITGFPVENSSGESLFDNAQYDSHDYAAHSTGLTYAPAPESNIFAGASDFATYYDPNGLLADAIASGDIESDYDHENALI